MINVEVIREELIEDWCDFVEDGFKKVLDLGYDRLYGCPGWEGQGVGEYYRMMLFSVLVKKYDCTPTVERLFQEIKNLEEGKLRDNFMKHYGNLNDDEVKKYIFMLIKSNCLYTVISYGRFDNDILSEITRKIAARN